MGWIPTYVPSLSGASTPVVEPCELRTTLFRYREKKAKMRRDVGWFLHRKDDRKRSTQRFEFKSAWLNLLSEYFMKIDFNNKFVHEFRYAIIIIISPHEQRMVRIIIETDSADSLFEYASPHFVRMQIRRGSYWRGFRSSTQRPTIVPIPLSQSTAQNLAHISTLCHFSGRLIGRRTPIISPTKLCSI